MSTDTKHPIVNDVSLYVKASVLYVVCVGGFQPLPFVKSNQEQHVLRMTAFTLQSNHRKVDDKCASNMFSVSETDARTIKIVPLGDLRQHSALHLFLWLFLHNYIGLQSCKMCAEQKDQHRLTCINIPTGY